MRTLRPLSFLALVFCLILGKNVLAALPAETPVSDPLFGDIHGAQHDIAIASDGEDYLAVWQDTRARHYDAILAGRVNAAGEPLDPTGIFIRRGPIADLGVVWSGDAYTVVWSTHEDVHPEALLAVRIDRDGNVLGEPRTLLLGGGFNGSRALASHGSRTLVAYYTLDGTPRAMLLDAQLNVLSDVALTNVATLAANDSGFLAVWTRGDDIQAVRISPSGAIVDATPVKIGEGNVHSVASDGRDFAVLLRTDAGFATIGVSADLRTVSPARLLPDAKEIESPSFFWAGDRYVVTAPRWKRGVLGSVAVTIDRAAVPAAAEPLQTNATFILAAASNGDDILAAWPLTYNSNDSSRSRLLARVFGGKPVEPRSAETQLTRAAAWQDDVAIAFGGSSYLVQWREEEGLYAARLGLDGRSLDGRGIELTREKTANGENVVWDGTQYVVSWTERRDGALTSVIRFVSPSQGLLEEQLVGAGLPLTAGPDGVTLLGFSDDDGRLRVRRLFGASRTFENASVAVTPAGERAGNPAAAWNGSEYLVVWNELELDRWSWQFEFWVGARVRGARVSRELTVRDTRPITIGDAPERVDHVTGIASDGSGWLVTWETEYTSIRARRVASDLTLARELFFGTGFGSTVTFDATRYVVGWRGVQPASAVTIADVTRAGALRGIDVVTATEMPGRISLAPGAIAYTRLTRELGGVPRAYVRGLEAVTIRRRAVR